MQVCPFCADADAVSRIPIGDGLWRYTCSYVRKHVQPAPYSWDGSDDERLAEDSGGTGLAEELGLYDDLLCCLVAGEPWIEYGIVEHRLGQLQPKTYAELLERYGHTRQGPKKYTASAFVASSLGWMREHGMVEWQEGPATGYWSYNSVVSYWALPPAPPSSQRLTYLEYAKSIGLDPFL